MSACQCGWRPRFSRLREVRLSSLACLTVPAMGVPRPKMDQRSRLVPLFAAVCAVTKYMISNEVFKFGRLPAFTRRALSRRKQGFESPRQRHLHILAL